MSQCSVFSHSHLMCKLHLVGWLAALIVEARRGSQRALRIRDPLQTYRLVAYDYHFHSGPVEPNPRGLVLTTGMV